VTAGEARGRAARRLAQAGIATADLDAELLLRHVLGWDRATLLTREREPLPAAAEASFDQLVGQRAQRRPLQHLTGVQHFWRHVFAVSPDVLIPRPETELLVEAALRLMEGVPDPVVVDVGTGSGCIALSLAAERPDAVCHAVDSSPAALAVARENARRLGLEKRVTFHQGDLLGPVEELAGTVHLVVSNPPYVEASELVGLEPEVRDHEPRAALIAVGSRYSVYWRLVPEAAAILWPGGALAVEVGQGMAEEVSRTCRNAGLDPFPPLLDLAGISRVVVSQKLSGPR
jgi:release factor glutamine methyltransferase